MKLSEKQFARIVEATARGGEAYRRARAALDAELTRPVGPGDVLLLAGGRLAFEVDLRGWNLADPEKSPVILPAAW